MNLDAVPCDTCRGARHVRGPNGWIPCECFLTAVGLAFVKPMIRQGETALDPVWLAQEPWGLRDRVETGDYETFRCMVWRSLLAYVDRRPRYDYFEGFRLTEIHFNRDPEYLSSRALKDLDLLVLVMGRNQPPMPWIDVVFRYVVDLRHMHGLPTWVYRAPTADRVSLPPVSDEPKVPKRRNPSGLLT